MKKQLVGLGLMFLMGWVGAYFVYHKDEYAFQTQLVRPPLSEKFKDRKEGSYFWEATPETIRLQIRKDFPEARDYVVCEADLITGAPNEYVVSFQNGEKGSRKTLLFEFNRDRSLKPPMDLSELAGEHFELVCRHAILEMRHPDFQAANGAEKQVEFFQRSNLEVIRVREFQGAVYSYIGYDLNENTFIQLGKRSLSK